MTYKSTLVVLVLITAVAVAGCGRYPDPVTEMNPTREPVTLVPRAAQGEVVEEATEVPPTEAPTEVPPTVEPTVAPTEVPPTIAPTSTPVPPTEAPVAIGDAAAGEVLFKGGKDIAPPCSTCHIVDQDMILIGPSMVGIAERAATRVAGLSAEEYLHQSIVDPNAYLVPNTDTHIFAAGNVSLMFQQYSEYLSDSDVNDLVAYMLTFE